MFRVEVLMETDHKTVWAELPNRFPTSDKAIDHAEIFFGENDNCHGWRVFDPNGREIRKEDRLGQH
jgi:hypothetical protein